MNRKRNRKLDNNILYKAIRRKDNFDKIKKNIENINIEQKNNLQEVDREIFKEVKIFLSCNEVRKELNNLILSQGIPKNTIAK